MNVESRVVEEPSPNYETLKAMEDVKQGKGEKVNDSEELLLNWVSDVYSCLHQQVQPP
jgi:hypothetical protein